jgi:membrane-associated phospholipid phosphatase
MIAGIVAFSRIYLGDHYPGDVMSGSGLGMIFAMFFRWGEVVEEKVTIRLE